MNFAQYMLVIMNNFMMYHITILQVLFFFTLSKIAYYKKKKLRPRQAVFYNVHVCTLIITIAQSNASSTSPAQVFAELNKIVKLLFSDQILIH